MNPFSKRKNEDLKKIKEMMVSYGAAIELLSVNDMISSIVVRINVPTARNRNYPTEIQQSSDIQIDLPARYPFEGPKAKVITPIWNPNIFSNGNICLGTKWLPTEGLDLLIERILKLLVFDPLVVNLDSPANAEAKAWYAESKTKMPSAFPTKNISDLKRLKAKPSFTWKNMETSAPVKISMSCPKCLVSLKISNENKDKNIKCPNCANVFKV